MEDSVRLCLPPLPVVAQDNPQSPQGQGTTSAFSTQVADEGMVHGPTQHVNTDSVGIAVDLQPTVPEGPVSQQSANPVADGMENKRRQLREQGFPDKSVDIILAARATTTRSVYSTQWDAFSDWCGRSNCDPLRADVTQIVAFLQSLFEEDRKPSTLRVYCSAINYFRGPIDDSRC